MECFTSPKISGKPQLFLRVGISCTFQWGNRNETTLRLFSANWSMFFFRSKEQKNMNGSIEPGWLGNPLKYFLPSRLIHCCNKWLFIQKKSFWIVWFLNSLVTLNMSLSSPPHSNPVKLNLLYVIANLLIGSRALFFILEK